MKISKAFTLFAAALCAAGAFADASNLLVSFYSTDDYYADGTRVLPGEWYALCWSPRTEFGGITYDFKPAVEGDIIFDMMPRAKVYEDGNVGCKYTVFQIDSLKVPSGGNYFVYLLDTRNADGTAVAKETTNEDGTRVPDTTLSGASVSGSYTATAFNGKRGKKRTATASNVANGKIGTWDESALPADFKTPRIVDFKLIDSATVRISVADMMPGVKYNVRMGATPSEMTSYRVQAPKTVAVEGETVPFEVSAADAAFFQIVRQPIRQKVEE
jgi:hypothetical protein